MPYIPRPSVHVDLSHILTFNIPIRLVFSHSHAWCSSPQGNGLGSAIGVVALRVMG